MVVFPPERYELVSNLLSVPNKKVSAALGDLTFIECNIGKGSIVKATPNPALYVGVTVGCSEKKKLILSQDVRRNNIMLEREYGEDVAPPVVAGKTILLDSFSSYEGEEWFYYGIVLHEMAHAWAERCTKEESQLPLNMAFSNSEENAWLFEIQWVCDLAYSSNPYAADMRQHIIDYFNRAGSRFGDKAKAHVKWSLERIGFASHIPDLDSAIFH